MDDNDLVIPPNRESARRESRASNRTKALHRALPILLILLVAAILRFRGLDWDEGHWLHPDERQIFFVVSDLGWPDSETQAFSSDSPLNPHFFAYGSLPIYLLKLVIAVLRPLWAALGDDANMHLIARPLAALTVHDELGL